MNPPRQVCVKNVGKEKVWMLLKKDAEKQMHSSLVTTYSEYEIISKLQKELQEYEK